MKQIDLEKIAKIIRYYILFSTTKAGSGHPTSSLSAVEIVSALFFNNFIKIDFNKPKDITNDRFILSKGHAAPLIYSLYVLLGYLNQDQLLTLRKFNSQLQGHPIPDDFLIDVATGSLGQGLSIGLGMALGLQLKISEEKFEGKRLPKVWVLLGDSEIAEGQVWEAVALSSYYKVENLIAVVDVNRLGQRGETMLGWDCQSLLNRFTAFGWESFLVDDGHNFEKLNAIFKKVLESKNKKPKVVLIKTIKGKGVSFLQDKENWHGKALNDDLFQKALIELKPVIPKNFSLRKISKKTNQFFSEKYSDLQFEESNYQKNQLISTREAYGLTLKKIGKKFKNMVVLDAEVSNSTYSQFFKEIFPKRFFEMFVAEQNMISVALGFSKVGFVPFCSTFAAFLTRGFDQIRMASYSNANLKICGSHGGVSIGEDGVSQMGLEDLSMMRSIFSSVVLYPSDAVSTEKLLIESLKYQGIVYIRTTRAETPVIYHQKENFEIGGLKILKKSSADLVVLITAGITLQEAIKAYQKLKKENIFVRVIDLYCLKPINKEKLLKAIGKIRNIITIEDHYLAGGLGEAVSSILSFGFYSIIHLAVTKMPKSGKKEQLLNYEKIDSQAIIDQVKKFFHKNNQLINKKEKNPPSSIDDILKKLNNFLIKKNNQ